MNNKHANYLFTIKNGNYGIILILVYEIFPIEKSSNKLTIYNEFIDTDIFRLVCHTTD